MNPEINDDSIVQPDAALPDIEQRRQVQLADDHAFAEILGGELIDPDQVEPAILRTIAMALSKTVDDIGAPFEKNTIAALKVLWQADTSEYFRQREKFKKANKSVSLKTLDDLVQGRPAAQPASPNKISRNSLCPQLTTGTVSEAKLDVVDHHSSNEKTGCLVHYTEKGPKLVSESKAATQLAAELKGSYVFCQKAQAWHHFSGTHWAECTAGAIDSALVGLLTDWTDPIGFSNNYSKGCLALLAKSQLLPLPSPPAGHIPFANGLLNPITFALTPISPETAATWCLPYAWDPGSECPLFLDWLHHTVDDDTGTVQLLRGYLNAVLTGRPDLQRFLHLYGPAGTGKSTFVSLFVLLVGKQNVITTDLRNLEQNRFETASLYGKRLAVINDADKYGGAVNVLKAMTGQDPLRLERKHHQQAGTFIFEGQTVIVSNELLATTDYSSGIERRRITVEFQRCLTARERMEWNNRGGEEMILHREAPGIVRWALGMAREEVDQIFSAPPVRTRQSNIEALLANNPVADWLLECVRPDPGVWTKVGNKQESREGGRIRYDHSEEWLYPNYLSWCLANGREALALRRFSDRVIDMAKSFGAAVEKPVRRRDGCGIVGIRLREPYEAQWLPIAIHSEMDRAGERCEEYVKTHTSLNVNADGGVKDVKDATPTFSYNACGRTCEE